MADVFISYHEESAGDVARQIADALESVGISCWYAKRDIPPGGDFARNIPSQIDACKIFLLILKDGLYESRHIENELGLAFSRLNHGEEITILPVEIGNFKRKSWLRYYLVHAQSFKIPLLNETRIRELSVKIIRILGGNQKTPVKIIKSGACGHTVKYALHESGALAISGIGNMWDCGQNGILNLLSIPWLTERGVIGSAHVGVNVTSIGSGAFFDCFNLKSVAISDSVAYIGDGAFYNCRNLTAVNVPESVSYIGVRAFHGCPNLTSVSVPARAWIEYGAFPYATAVMRRPPR